MLRPPYGFVDETLKQWAKTPIVCWSVDTEDWKDQNVERIVQTVTQQAEDGDIILMHDIFETSVTAALACVDRLMAQGYYFVDGGGTVCPAGGGSPGGRGLSQSAPQD